MSDHIEQQLKEALAMEPPQAISLLENLANQHPTHYQTLCHLALMYMKHNRLDDALKHFHQALQLQPEDPQIHFHLGVLMLRLNHCEAAKKQFQNVLALDARRGDALFYLGVLALADEDNEQALGLFKRCLKFKPDDPDILCNIGVSYLRLNEGQKAIDHFTKALLIYDQHEDARSNLAATFMHYDRFENAMIHYEQLLEQSPDNQEYLYNQGVAAMTLGHLAQARTLFQRLLEIDPNHFAALNNLAALYLKDQQRDIAIHLLHKALRIKPDDAASQHMLAALEGQTVSSQQTQIYAKNLFDNYALYYDRHMRDALAYQLPHDIANMLSDHQVNRSGNILDLGCGTGLAMSLLLDKNQQITGVDLSEKMLQQAREKGIYQQLVQSDAIQFLVNDTHTYQLIIAADVFPYINPIEPLFTMVYQHLKSDGAFIFSIELSPQPKSILQQNGRYAHASVEVEQTLTKTGFNIIEARLIEGRKQQGEPVKMMIFLCTHS